MNAIERHKRTIALLTAYTKGQVITDANGFARRIKDGKDQYSHRGGWVDASGAFNIDPTKPPYFEDHTINDERELLAKLNERLAERGKRALVICRVYEVDSSLKLGDKDNIPQALYGGWLASTYLAPTCDSGREHTTLGSEAILYALEEDLDV